MISMLINLSLTIFLAIVNDSSGFVASKNNVPSFTSTSRCHSIPSPSSLNANKKKGGKSSGKGFGKAPEVKSGMTKPSSKSSNENVYIPNYSDEPVDSGLSSIETTTSTSFARPEAELDPNLSTDDRNKEILKQKFGLRSFEDRQVDAKEAERMAENKSRMQKIKQMKDDEFDIFMVVPPPVLRGIDVFLKGGLAICTILFIAAGFGITAEAWAVATGNMLPEDVDAFIVNVIEPNFTPGLLVLLGFSVSLGVFATAQMGSGSSTYKEQ